MSRITPFEEFEMNESNLESLKIVLNSLKKASDEEISRVTEVLSRKLTWGNIKDLADIVHVKIEK